MNLNKLIVSCIFSMAGVLHAEVIVTKLTTQVDGAVIYTGLYSVGGSTSYSDSGWHRPLYQKSFSITPYEIYGVNGLTNPIGNSSTTETLTFGSSSLSGVFVLSDQIYQTINPTSSSAFSHFSVNMDFTVVSSAVFTFSAAVNAINMDNGNPIQSGQTLGSGHYKFTQDFYNSDNVADQNVVTSTYSFNLQTTGPLTVVPETASIVSCALGFGVCGLIRRYASRRT